MTIPKKKSQHFVPRFYLKLFSVDKLGKAIGLRNVSSGIFVREAALKSQACKSYFYGSDCQIEESLSTIENHSASIIRNIIETNSCPAQCSEEHRRLLTFLIIQHARTEYALEEQNEMVDKMVKAVFTQQPELIGKLDKTRITWSEPIKMALQNAVINFPIAYDLTYKLFLNKTPTPFISSDNPVVFYNQYLESRVKTASTIGLACKGLQIFLPLSPAHVIVFYDKDVYKFGFRGKTTVSITESADVDALNQIQYINAFENVYYNNFTTEKYIRHLAEKTNPYKRTELAKVIECWAPSFDVDRRLLQLCKPDIRCNLRLTCCSIQKKARSFDLGDRVIHVRNENLCRLHKEFTILVQNGSYKGSDFSKYLRSLEGGPGRS